MIRSVCSAVHHGIFCTNTLRTFFETMYVQDWGKTSKLYRYKLLFVWCTRLELVNKTQMQPANFKLRSYSVIEHDARYLRHQDTGMLLYFVLQFEVSAILCKL